MFLFIFLTRKSPIELH